MARYGSIFSVPEHYYWFEEFASSIAAASYLAPRYFIVIYLSFQLFFFLMLFLF
jgi:hypothetical protein